MIIELLHSQFSPSLTFFAPLRKSELSKKCCEKKLSGVGSQKLLLKNSGRRLDYGMPKRFVCAVDGVSGSGKTTMAKSAARRLNLFYLETGFFYRAFTYQVLKEKVDVELVAARGKDILKNLLRDTRIDFRWDGKEGRVYVLGEDVTDRLKLPEVDRVVSYISELKEVREKMVREQRKIAAGKDVICEGRDIGSVVFPDADLKVFVDCRLEERVKRRMKELSEKGIFIPQEKIRKNLAERDRIDSQRTLSPLVKLPEAVYIDTTHLTIEEEAELLVGLIKSVRKEA